MKYAGWTNVHTHTLTYMEAYGQLISRYEDDDFS